MNRWTALLLPAIVALLGVAFVSAAMQIGAGDKPPVIRPPKKDKKTELPNQALEPLPQPPLALPADGTRLSFLSAPLTNSGLLSQQTRDELKWMIAQAHGAQFVRIRAFVAGSGDLRRIPQLVSETFADRHLSLPVVVAVQVGALPLQGAQVQFDAILQQGRTVNPAGVSFTSFEAESGAAAQTKLMQMGSHLERGTCYVPTLQILEIAVPLLPPSSMKVGTGGHLHLEDVAWIQPQRVLNPTTTWCEVVASNSGPAIPSQPLVFSGAQLAFSYSEEDARLAYERLEKTLKNANSTLKNAVFLNFYPLSSQLAELAYHTGAPYLDPAHEPAGVRKIVFEGLPSIDGSFAIEAVATVSNPN
jgi:enamine deaminase RidA (YjgF/YER057c/UK114 family)